MQQGQLSIHSENILPIIKKWLYSEKDIFVRELAANASDAIQKLGVLAAKGDATAIEPRIDITINATQKTLTFSDTGLGLDADDAEKYLSQIAFSGAEEFIKTYQMSDTFIGHFGLGFFSAFMVADTVEVISRSYKEPSTPIVWKSDGSTTYSIEPASKETVGTDVVLHIGKEHEEYLDEPKLRAILKRFCGFFSYPLFLNGQRINIDEPLWQKRPQDCSEKDYLDFYKVLYPFEEPPLFWVHLNVDYPFHVQGILYFPRFRPEHDLSKERIKLFSNRVFVSDDCKDILPDYLILLRGVLDSPDIPLNVSRSHLQVDTTVRQLSAHISKKVADALFSLFKTDRSRFEACWDAYELVVKLGMLQDEKFYTRAKEWLLWKTEGKKFKTLTEVTQLQGEKKTIIYCEPGQESSPLVAMYAEKGIDVIHSSCSLDHPLMARLERDGDLKFQRIDAAIDGSLLDPSRENTILDASGRTLAAHIEDFFRSALGNFVTVEAKSLQTSVPAILTLPEDERRFRDYMNRNCGKDLPMNAKASLVINTNSPLIQATYKAREKSSELAKILALHIYDLTRLSHRELPANDLHAFTERTSQLLEKLTTDLVHG